MGVNYNPDGSAAVLSIRNAVAITPHDDNDLSSPTKSIYCGVAGDVNLTMVSGETVLLKNMVQGMWHPIEAIRILATDTTALSLVASI